MVSRIDPTQPPQGQTPASSATLRAQFASAAQDIDDLQAQIVMSSDIATLTAATQFAGNEILAIDTGTAAKKVAVFQLPMLTVGVATVINEIRFFGNALQCSMSGVVPALSAMLYSINIDIGDATSGYNNIKTKAAIKQLPAEFGKAYQQSVITFDDITFDPNANVIYNFIWGMNNSISGPFSICIGSGNAGYQLQSQNIVFGFGNLISSISPLFHAGYGIDSLYNNSVVFANEGFSQSVDVVVPRFTFDQFTSGGEFLSMAGTNNRQGDLVGRIFVAIKGTRGTYAGKVGSFEIPFHVSNTGGTLTIKKGGSPSDAIPIYNGDFAFGPTNYPCISVDINVRLIIGINNLSIVSPNEFTMSARAVCVELL